MPYNERITALWKDLGDDYFLSSTPQDVARETEAILKQADPDQPIVLKRQDSQGSTTFILITQARDSLFAATTYFLERQNLTIVDAYIVSTQSEYTICGYTVLKDNQVEINSELEDIVKGLKQALVSDSNPEFNPIRRHIPRYLKQFMVPTRVTFTQDHINNHTIMALVTTDRPGVLSQIAQAFTLCQVRLKKAKIATFGTRVEDVFFITDYNNHALFSAEQLDCLRDKLFELLDMPKSEKS